MKHLKAEHYLSNFDSDDDNIKELCKIALETRKFEIDLYWKRATYFWAFIAADIAAYALVFTRVGDSLSKSVLMTALSMFGVLFSLGWYFVNWGNKYWQENWEDQMSLLVTRKYGPIFKILKFSKKGFFPLNGGYHFSVSKVNQWLSLFTFFMWLMLFVYSMLKVAGVNFAGCKLFNENRWILSGIFSGLLAGAGYILFRCSKTKLIEEYHKEKKNEEKKAKDNSGFIDTRSDEEIEKHKRFLKNTYNKKRNKIK